jgi:hypothetical protein
MNFKLLLIVLSLFVFACNDAATDKATDTNAAAQKSPEDSLYDAVMEGHDTGMAKMGKLKRTLNQIQHQLDSMVKLPSAKIDANYQQALIDLQEDLNYAEFGMNTWMEEFKIDSANDNKEVRIKYLQSEKEKVTKVRDNILNGLQRADSLLKK